MANEKVRRLRAELESRSVASCSGRLAMGYLWWKGLEAERSKVWPQPWSSSTCWGGASETEW